MNTTPTKEQRRIIMRLAGGNIDAGNSIREAAHRIVLNYASEEDYELVINHINETNIILA